MKIACSILVFVALLHFHQSKAQDQIDLQAFAERLFSVQDADVNYESIYESLLLYYTNPINLNKTDRDELASLYMLSPYQLQQFFEHRESNGSLLSINELQSIDGFDLGTIRDLKPFVTVEEKADSRSLIKRIRDEENHFILLRLNRNWEREKGYQTSQYAGNPNSMYCRYRLSRSHDFSFGITAEKDAGESFGWDEQNKSHGFDFYSWHASLQNKGMVKNATFGDYQMQFGQGLVFGAGFGSGKGSETVNTIKRNSTGVRPYSSSLESGFFRGVATTLQKRNTELTLFYSNILQDGNLKSDSTYSDFDEFVNSIQSTGFHRTETEIQSKNDIREQSYGAALQHHFQRRLEIGATILNTQYASPLQKKPNNYNQFEFKGKQNFITSIYVNYVWQNFIFFGEGARSSSGGTGTVAGFMTSLTPKIDFGMSFRNYDKHFHSFYGNAFSENSRIINEKGIYWGLKIQLSKKHSLAAYFDQFSFPWLKFQTESPSRGYEYLGRYTFRPSRSIVMYAQMRQENKQVTEGSEVLNLNTLTVGTKRNYLINVDYSLGRSFDFGTRVQASTYQIDGQTTTGYALIQDFNYNFWKIKLSTRMAIFDTDFNNRQYAYEKNVLYTFSIPAYNGSGTRTYIMAQWRATSNVSLWVRWAQFHYPNQETIGSGLTEVNGNTRSNLTIMARIKL